MKKITTIFSVISILIACLGLYGLAAYSAEQRTKELGIRKVLGASRMNLLYLLIMDFVRIISLSIIVSFPVIFRLMSGWLEEFAFSIDIGSTPFITAFVITLFIAMLTVSIQVIKAARSNPVDSLRYE